MKKFLEHWDFNAGQLGIEPRVAGSGSKFAKLCSTVCFPRQTIATFVAVVFVFIGAVVNAVVVVVFIVAVVFASAAVVVDNVVADIIVGFCCFLAYAFKLMI